MRQGELLALRRRDVDLEARSIQVRATLTWAEGVAAFSQPKTAKSRRQIRLTRLAADALREHRRCQLEQRLLVGQAWHDEDLVFPNGIGKPADPSNLLKLFRALLKRAGLPAIRFHDLRHTCATLMLLQGQPVKVVSEQLGHSQIALTLDTYSHVLPTMQDAAVDALDALLTRSRAVGNS